MQTLKIWIYYFCSSPTFLPMFWGHLAPLLAATLKFIVLQYVDWPNSTSNTISTTGLLVSTANGCHCTPFKMLTTPCWRQNQYEPPQEGDQPRVWGQLGQMLKQMLTKVGSNDLLYCPSIRTDFRIRAWEARHDGKHKSHQQITSVY